MSDLAIRVDHLSKQYRLGKQERYFSLRDSLTEACTAPFRRLRSLFRGSAGSGQSNSQTLFWALRDVSFEVKQGEVVGIIGRNGAGKSTLLKVLSRITEPTEGFAELRGRVGSLLEVGTGFHPELTGRENLYLNGAILGMKKAEIERKFDEIVAFAEVEKFLDTPVKHYSSGMYVRLAFAVAAHLEPEILMVDEVLAVGDAAFQKKCLGKMEDVAKEGRTVLFVSHNMGAIEALCERVIVIGEGIVVFDGDKKRAIAKYLVNSQSRAIKPLLSRKDRSGNGWLRITEISTYIENQPNSGYWQTGETCLVRFAYQTANDVSINQVDIGFAIEDTHGRKLLYANTIVTKKHIKLTGSSGVIYCKIERFPLSKGEYYLSYDVFADGQLLDKVHNAALIAVEDGFETLASWGGYGTVCTLYQWGHQ